MSTGFAPDSAAPSTTGSTVSEALPKLAPGHVRSSGSPPGQFAFGLADPVECGKKGARASVLARRLAGQRRLEEKIEASRSGQAQAFLLRVRMEREAKLEAERVRLDRWCCELLDEVDAARAEREREEA